MQDIQNSELLEKLLKKAMTSEEGEVPLTAGRFLLAAVERLYDRADPPGQEEAAELQPLADCFKKRRIDAHKAVSQLREMVDSLQGTRMSEKLCITERIYAAREEAKSRNKEKLTADLVLAGLIREPSKLVESFLEENSRKKPVIEESDIAGLLEKRRKQKQDAASRTDGGTDRPKRRPLRLDEPEKEEEGDPLSEDGPLPGGEKEWMTSLVETVKKTRATLLENIFGQDKAVSVLTNGYFQGELVSQVDLERSRPRATFLFAGPPGVGKTFLAETAAKVLKLPYKRFDMSEYSDKEAVVMLCGSDPVYKDSQPGVLTGFVNENPKCILLFDEIEKAHINAIHLFLQLLDAGRLADAKTRKEVSFADTIVIFTTNAGKELYENSETGDLSGLSRKVILKALENDRDPETQVPFFPPAICSRFASGNVVMFNYLSAHTLRDIARSVITKQADNIERELGLKTRVDENVYTALLLAEGGAADARMIRGRSQAFYTEELFELLRLIDSEKARTDIKDLEEVRFSVQLPENDEKIRSLFETPADTKALVFAPEADVAWCRDNQSACRILGAQDREEAVRLLHENDVQFVMLDLELPQTDEGEKFLNVEDIESETRDFLWFIREKHGELPVYLIAKNDEQLSLEEELSFRRIGVQDFIDIGGNAESFDASLKKICENLHQRQNIINLAKANKLVSFETGQRISADGKIADICLFDFEFLTAVDAEDSKNILSSISMPDVHFADVIGAEDAKRELADFIEYLRNPKKFIGTGISAPKGVLLYGPPGTGKTMLAKATACEAGVTILTAQGNQFLKSHVGEGPESVRDMFRKARKYAPSILFVDEIDAIAKQRTGSEQNGPNEEILTAFLAEMDGFQTDSAKPVFVLAATNFDVEPGQKTSLDSALMRRFDRRIYVGLPNKEERIRYLKKQYGKKPIFSVSETMTENIAVRSTGMSLASLASVIELSLRMAIRDGSLKVTDQVFEEAFETFNSGEVKKWDPSELERTARHEAGHAFLSWESGKTPAYLTVVARGNHGGYMQHADNENKGTYTKEELLARIRTALGGRAAEIVYYGEAGGLSTGASGDLAHATSIAKRILCAYGMDEDFGLAVVGPEHADTPEIRAAVNRILKGEMARAVKLITENRDKMDALVSTLINANRMTGEEIEAILAKTAAAV